MRYEMLTSTQVIQRNGKIVAMEFYKMEQDDEGKWVQDEDSLIRVKCDYIISAFGSAVKDDEVIKVPPRD